MERLVWVLLVATAAAVLAQPRTKRLTAFGKNPSNSATNAHRSGKTRDCRSDSDCQGMPATLCLAQPRDGKKKCLCRDYSVPLNGTCPTKFRAKRGYLPPGNARRPSKGLREKCESDSDCLEGGECRISTNSTHSRPVKLCLCQHGRTEQNNLCSGAMKLKDLQLLIVLISMAILTSFNH